MVQSPLPRRRRDLHHDFWFFLHDVVIRHRDDYRSTHFKAFFPKHLTTLATFTIKVQLSCYCIVKFSRLYFTFKRQFFSRGQQTIASCIFGVKSSCKANCLGIGARMWTWLIGGISDSYLGGRRRRLNDWVRAKATIKVCWSEKGIQKWRHLWFQVGSWEDAIR